MSTNLLVSSRFPRRAHGARPGARRWSQLAVLIASIAAAGGCAAPGTVREQERTGGLEVSLRTLTPDASATIYRVDRDGRIHFGGGMDAVLETYSWSGPLTEEQIAEVRALMTRHGNFRRRPASTGSPPRLVRRLTVRDDRGRRRHEVVGECPPLIELEELLEALCGERLDPFLDRLPAPGLQP